jgi:spermidine/putrescine transport system substrate-binding protein
MPNEDIDGIVERMLDGSEHSRRQFIRHLAAAGLLVGPGSAFLAACGGVKGEKASTQVATTASHPKTTIGNWTFSNWPLYIDKSVLKSFDKQYGGHVKYVEDINDNFEFFGKVRQQLQAKKPIGRDIVVLTDYMAARWVRDGYVTAIDKQNVPNAKNLVPELQDITYDPKRNFTLPWQSGAIGIGYDPRKTGRKLNSIQDFFDPKFKGRVSFLQEPYDSAGMVMLLQGVNSTKANIDQINKAIDKIEEAQKAGQIRRFTGNDYTTDLTKGNLWVAMAYSGDIAGLQADNPNLEFVYPKEGSMIFTDNMMIPAKAAHPYAAETMMNYVYDPEVAAKLAAYIYYISPVAGAEQIIQKTDPKLAANPLLFPSEEIRKGFHPYPTLSPADEREMEERMAQVTGA